MQTSKPLRFSVRGLLIAVTLVSFLLFTVVWLANNISSFSPFPFPEVEPKPFDQAEWKAWSIEDMQQSEDIRLAFARRDMLDSLLATHNFGGWTTVELTNLLGASDPEFCPVEWDVAYLLGPDWVDDVVLVFRLDKDGKVVSYQVILL
jgi:hypothetical protein